MMLTETSSHSTQILAGQIFDPYLLKLIPNQVITVSQESGLILDVQPLDEDLDYFSDPKTIDLRHLTVVPGFVDVHVHCG